MSSLSFLPHIPLELMPPLMFAGLVLAMLIGFPVAFTLAAVGLSFGFLAIHEGFFGLDREKLARAKKDVLVMHPGPMNRGVEIDSEIADDPIHSVIGEQVEMGVAVRMAVLDVLSRQATRNMGARNA